MALIALARSTRIDVAAEAAWDVVTAYDRDPTWRTGVVSMAVEPAGPLVVGATTDEQLKVAGKTYRNLGVVTSLAPGRRFDWRTTEGAQACGSRSVEPLGPTSCEVRLALEAVPRGFERVLAPVLRRILARNLERDLTALRRLLEDGVPASAAVAEGRAT